MTILDGTQIITLTAERETYKAMADSLREELNALASQRATMVTANDALKAELRSETNKNGILRERNAALVAALDGAAIGIQHSRDMGTTGTVWSEHPGSVLYGIRAALNER